MFALPVRPLTYHLIFHLRSSPYHQAAAFSAHMASLMSVTGGGFCGQLPFGGVSRKAVAAPRRVVVVVRAEAGAQSINPAVRKEEGKVVDSVVVTELSKPLTAYCRCWRSGTFPLCDGSHVKHNKATGDNVGPLLLKKQ